MKTNVACINEKHRGARIAKAICYAAMVAFVFALVVKGAPMIVAFADGATAADKAVEIILNVLSTVCIVLGVFFLISGIVQTAIAYADAQGSRSNEGLTKAAVGIALVILGGGVLLGFKDTLVELITSALPT